MNEENAYESFITLLPEWLMFGHLIYMIIQRYCSWPTLSVLFLSGFSSASLFFMASGQPQFIFELSIVLFGLVLSGVVRSKNSQKLTIPIVFTAINLILMVIVKARWLYYAQDSNDFMLRYFFNQIFIVSNLLSLFYN